MSTDKTKFTLITNIQFMHRDNFRVNCHALLICEDDSKEFLSTGYRLRGFGTEAAWDVMSMWLDKEKHFPFSFTPAQDRSSGFLSQDGKSVRPIFSGNTLRFKDGTEFFLQAADDSLTIDVHTQIGDIREVWRVLYVKTALYWQSPYMPRLRYGPPTFTVPKVYA